MPRVTSLASLDRLQIVCCKCGTSFEARSDDAEIIGCAREHRARCGGEVEWWLLVEEPPPAPAVHISVGFIDRLR